MASFRAIRACNVDPSKLTFPTWVMPKIDGVRGLNPYGTLLTRTLALMPNLHTRERFSDNACQGMDGELAAGLETDDDLCRKTTSATMSKEGEPDVVWHVFDLCDPSVKDLPYRERYAMLAKWVETCHSNGHLPHIKVVPFREIYSLQEFDEAEAEWLDMGYEGIIQRDPDGIYKWGKSTERQAIYTRRKPYEDTEGVLVVVHEAMENLNEATVDAQGLTKRSSHQENKIGKGMSGALEVRRLSDGEVVRIGPGKLSHPERVALWNEKEQAIAEGRIVKYRHFPKGVLNKPRQGRFLCWRSSDDILPEESE